MGIDGSLALSRFLGQSLHFSLDFTFSNIQPFGTMALSLLPDLLVEKLYIVQLACSQTSSVWH